MGRILDTLHDLAVGAKSITLTMSAGVGSVPIPDTAHIIGVKPVSSSTMRVGLEAPEADGSHTGAAAAADLKKGIPVDSAAWTWFNIGLVTTSRSLYIYSSGQADVIEVVVM